MKLTSFTLSAFLFCSIISLYGQTTLSLQPGPAQGQDALLHGLASEVNVNYGSNGQFAANAWTFNGTEGVVRSIIQFDLSSIPVGARVDSAFLSFYAWDTTTGFGQHSTRSGSNAGWLQRVTSSWDEASVTWNTSPSTTSQNQVALPASTSPTEDYLNVDVKSLVQDMVNDPTMSFGFMMRLQEESIFRLLNFASSDHGDSTRRPRLVVVYEEQIYADTCITLQPHATEGKDALLHGLVSEANVNYGSNGQFAANAWTFNGVEGVVRSVIQFDFSSIPAGAIVDSAYLSLYAWDTTAGFGQHSTRSGSNAGWLQRVTSSWDEATVTWNTSPSTTTQNQVALSASTSPTEDYLNIEVKSLVQDMLDDPSMSFGFMMRLQDESIFRLLNFASSDHADSTRHPKIKIYYKENITSIRPNIREQVQFDLYPNPAKNLLRIAIQQPISTHIQLKLLNLQGQMIKQLTLSGNETEIDISGISSGIYYVLIQDGNRLSSKKLLVE